MKYIVVMFLLLFTVPAVGGLYMKQDANTMIYHMYGDMDEIRVSEQTKDGIPSSVRPTWPSKNGIWILVAHLGPMKQSPIYVGPNLLATDNASSVLSQVAANSLSSGVALPYVMEGALQSLVFMVCDYKTNNPMMTCKMALAAAGQIKPPPPVEHTLSCSITGAIDLHHGNLTLETVANDSAQTFVLVSCSRSATVSLSIEGMVKLNGVDGLYSQLTVGDAPVGSAYSFTADTSYTPVNFKSVLRTVGKVTPGNFNGSARVVLTFP